MQDSYKETVKNWLKENKRVYSWLAEKCFVKETAVRAWFKKNGEIPSSKKPLIDALMKEDEEKKETFVLDFNEEELEYIQQFQRDYPDIDFKQFCQDVTIRFAESVSNVKFQYKKKIDEPKPKYTIEVIGSVSADPLYPMPIVGHIAAGGLIHGDIESPYSINVNDKFGKDYYGLHVTGYSMSPDIPNDSHVIVKKWTEPYLPKPGTIVVYHDGRGVTLKRLIKMKLPNRDSEYVLQSINPEFDDITPIDGGCVSAVFVKAVK